MGCKILKSELYKGILRSLRKEYSVLLSALRIIKYRSREPGKGSFGAFLVLTHVFNSALSLLLFLTWAQGCRIMILPRISRVTLYEVSSVSLPSFPGHTMAVMVIYLPRRCALKAF